MDASGKAFELALIVLQAFQVGLLWIHDWVPLGRLNDVRAVQSQDTRLQLVVVTLLQSLPFSIPLFFSAWYFGQHYPHWLLMWLWIAYGIAILGYLRAWWIPYLFCVDAKKAARYEVMFGNTHAFLPKRHGIVVNTLHVMLHGTWVAILLVLLAPVFRMP